jgi:hypothetical protein
MHDSHIVVRSSTATYIRILLEQKDLIALIEPYIDSIALELVSSLSDADADVRAEVRKTLITFTALFPERRAALYKDLSVNVQKLLEKTIEDTAPDTVFGNVLDK